MFLRIRISSFIVCAAITCYFFTSIHSVASISLDAPITAYTITDDATNAYVGAALQDQKDFTIWHVTPQFSVPVSITPTTARVNNKDEQPNPLLGKTITRIKPMSYNKSLVITTAQEPGVLYTFIAPTATKGIIYSTNPLINFDKSSNTRIQQFECGQLNYIFAAISSCDDSQDRTTGLAVVKLEEKKLENEAKQLELSQVNPFQKKIELPKTDEKDNEQKKEEAAKESQPVQEPDIRAIPVTRESPFVRINHPLTKDPKITCLHWNQRLESLFIGMEAQAGEEDDAGVCGLAIAKIDSLDQLVTMTAVVPTALTPGDTSGIVASLGARSSVAMHHITTLHTSTDLEYVIVVGGIGTNQDNKNRVHALPLYNPRERSVDKGLIANAQQELETGKNPARYHYVAIREFKEPASKPEHLLSAQSPQTRVGTQPLANGPISHIACIGDTVFVSVEQPYEGYQPGIFSSQALFDAQGAIASWTSWQPVSAINDATSYFAISYPQRKIMWFSKNENEQVSVHHHSLDQVLQEPNDHAKALTEIFTQDGGITFMHAFNQNDAYVGNHPLILSTSQTKIALSSAQQTQGAPCVFACTLPTSERITLDPSSIILLEDEVLKNLKPITCATFAGSTDNYFLVVGGSKGIAIACNSDGSGFTSADTFSIEPSMRFKMIGSFKSVKKVIADGIYLYVLTSKSVYRINIVKSNFEENNLDCVELTRASDFQTSVLCDMLIGDSCALLATGSGLYRSTENSDIRIESQKGIHWKALHLPEMVLPITRLYAYTSSYCQQDIFRRGGMVHVVGSYRGKNKTHIHRLIVAPTEPEKIVNDAAITLLSEIYQDGNSANFAGYQTHKEIFVTDGATYFSAPSSLKNPSLVCGMEKHETVNLNMKTEDKIHTMIKNNVTGQWFIAGTFGLIIY